MTRIHLEDVASDISVEPTPAGLVALTLDFGRVKVRAMIRPADAERLGRALLGAGPAPHVEPDRAPPPAKERHDWEGRRPRPGPARPPGTDRAPKTGKGLFRWLKEQEERIGSPGLIGYVNQWARLQDFPARMVDFDQDQVGDAYVEACRKLAEIAAAPEELREEVRP